ncbi:hypothetical protein CTI12_AA454640 [Artemisia annua]|uniref:Uncharacterized protein n=1 Tax=Artemisia annua TaxID=35608 RepID=A0A2U1LTN7_ARTAN|nr:hypothetical protein CTI12_AA454640 [Artemisia annua]
MNVAGSPKLHDGMRLWFVQQGDETDALSKLIFSCCMHLRRVIAKNHSMMANMEGLCDRDVAMESLVSLKKTQERHQLMLNKFNDLFNEAKDGVREEVANAVKMNKFN